jgi:LCP family protein required for cell wall assembly
MMAGDDRQGNDPGGQEPPDYTVYRSRRGVSLPRPDLAGLRDRLSRGEKPERPRPPGAPPGPGEPKRRWGKPALIVIAVLIIWPLVSLIAFAVSSQIQKGKLAGNIGDVIDGGPFLAFSAQNILVLGTDVRAPEFASDDEKAAKKCYEAAARGKNPPVGCDPYRADTIMIVRAGGGAFEKLSIPRDTYAAIPNHDAQKINAAYAFGGAALQVRTVEDFLGIDIDQVAIVDFRGFVDFIDALGGIEVDLDEPVCSEISGGAENGGITLELPEGESTLNGDEALALSRTRISDCDGDGNADAPLPDVFRAGLQQAVISGIKGRITSPLRLPYNFIKGPIIAWTAPQALVSSMGALLMPQLLFASVIGGDSETKILEPSSAAGPGGSLIVPQEECLDAVRELLGEDPERTPVCSPG